MSSVTDITTAGARPVNISGTIAAGNTAQTLIRANPSIRGYRIYNASSADLWINDTGAAATTASPSEIIPANSWYRSDFGGASTLGVSIIGATTGQAFTARYW